MRLINGSRLLTASIIRSMRLVCRTKEELKALLKRAGFSVYASEFEFTISGGDVERLRQFRAECECVTLSRSIDRALARH